jgi:hypothetical protein
MIIPESNLIDVAKLNTVFNNTTATYKYYWFLAILEASNFEDRIIKKRIFAGMVANAWYTVQYFQLKFGPHDLLHDAIKTIQNYFGENNIPIDARKNLNAHKLKFWDIYLKESIEEKCIYSGNKLSIGNYAVEHFIPHQFVAHDLMWNLVPADPIFNSIKRK